jgi:endogenous inhibitor of DNA gyrase (YacG/DUF329 family)
VSRYVCPRCGAVSHHPKDAEFRFCGRCHRFEDDPEPFDAQDVIDGKGLDRFG